jgi:hypothetical protein
MKTKVILISAAIVATLALVGILSFLPLTGCNGDPACCPDKDATALSVAPEYICDPKCVPGGNSVTLTAAINYQKSGQLCKPDKFSAKIMNNTKAAEIKNINWQNPSTGTYQTYLTQTVDATTDFELTAFGCQTTVTEACKVQVLTSTSVDSFYLCTSKGDLQGLGVWEFPSESNKYGKGIIIDRIVNPRTNKYSVKVTYKYQAIPPEISLNPGGESNGFYGQKAGYGWQVTIPMADWNEYKQDPKANDFCIKVYFTCKCEPG